MNKILSRIAIAVASFAMAIGGISIVSIHNKEQAKPAYAENGDVVATFDGYKNLSYSHGEHITRNGWKLSWGHSYKCGFDSGEWKTIEEQGYSKYINDTTISPDAYGWVLTKIDPLTFVGGFDFQASYPPASYLYLTYSLDDITYSLVPLTNGSQGAKLDTSNQTRSFDFNSIREAYYAVVVISETTNPASNQDFEFDYVLCHFYEKIDPSAERITVSGPNAVYADEDIELTITAYNFNPTEYTLTSSDTSIATVSRNGNIISVHGVNKGTASIALSTTGTNGIVYIDPITIIVKRFDFTIDFSSITLNVYETKNIYFDRYQDKNGDIVLEAVSANTNIVSVELDYTKVSFSAGTIGGISTTVTLTAKDNGGAEGYHIATKTITVTIGAHRVFGERITSSPDEYTYVYIATIDGNHFIGANKVYYDEKYYYYHLIVTNDFKDAALFAFDGFDCLFFNEMPLSISWGNLDLGYSSVHFDTDMSYGKYPGLLVCDGYFICCENETEIECLSFNDLYYYDEDGYISPSNVFCAYYAVDPGANITPEETSAELLQGESTDIDAEVAFVSNATYEIISGDECIEEVTVSAVDEFNHININIQASDISGTAIIRVKDANDDSVYTDITVRVRINLETSLENLITQTQLSYHYEKDEDEYTFTNISIRFGGKINKDIWNQINSDYGIQGFGVMITATETNPFLIKDHLDMADLVENDPDINTAIVDYYMPTSGEGSMATPPEVGDDYVYNLFHRVDYLDRYKVYTATAYIKISDDNYVFMNQVRYSVSSLAADYIANRGYDNSTAGGSLAVLSVPQA